MPPSWAAQNGHEAVVKLLVKRRAEMESKDNDGQNVALAAMLWA